LKRFSFWLTGTLWIFGSLAMSFLLPAPDAHGQDLHTYSVTLSGGIGGSFDAEPDTGLDNDSFQLGLSMITDPRSLLTARIGQVSLDGDEGFGNLLEADLTYLTLGGEYRIRKPYFDSGLYLALGGYQLEGTDIAGQDGDDTAIGVAMGTTADFPINRYLSVMAELSGHFVDLDEAQFFGMLHLGLSFHF
jgi:hypothetical protein